MSTSDDFEDVIAAEIPDDIVEELIRGAFEPELPTELVLVGRVLRAAQGPIPGEDRAREAEVVEAMLAAMVVTPITAARPSPRGRTRRRALVAVTAAVSVLGIGGVAAAAGSLPAPIQSFVSDSLSHVGVSVPSSEDEPSPPEPDATETGVHASDQADDAPGQSGATPGQSGATPGQSGNTPGHSGSEPPGQSGNTPGQSGNTPGQSGNTPGQSGDTPGQSGDTPGKSGDTPGHSGATAGQSGVTPTAPDEAHGLSDHKPDDAGKPGQPDE